MFADDGLKALTPACGNRPWHCQPCLRGHGVVRLEGFARQRVSLFLHLRFYL